MRGELPVRIGRLDGPAAAALLWSRLFAGLQNPEFLAVFYFCVLGLLLTACVLIQSVPDFGDMQGTSGLMENGF
jgi:hypothetical protein